jgi:hypothetical protein
MGGGGIRKGIIYPVLALYQGWNKAFMQTRFSDVTFKHVNRLILAAPYGYTFMKLKV